MKNPWISVDITLPDKSCEVEFKTLATTGKTVYNFYDRFFDYDWECVNNTNIAGYGTPDRITHWRPIKPQT